MREYEVISQFYGTRKAARSQVPLINHIDEGLELLDSDLLKRAFCLHPLVQNEEPLDLSWSEALPLAQEYARKANAYLCRPETDYVKTSEQLLALTGSLGSEVASMLLADKTQNQRDFNKYHKDSHPRSQQLTEYFDLWIATCLKQKQQFSTL